MTDKEAAEIIKVARAEVEWEYPMEYAAAFDKAIEALEKCDKIEKIIKSWKDGTIEEKDMVAINNRLNDFSERIENIEKQMQEEKEEELKKLEAELNNWINQRKSGK